jgi:hypothetical protein
MSGTLARGTVVSVGDQLDQVVMLVELEGKGVVVESFPIDKAGEFADAEMGKRALGLAFGTRVTLSYVGTGLFRHVTGLTISEDWQANP